MDVLSTILAPLRVRGAVFCKGRVGAPWAIQGGNAPMPVFHVAVSGQGYARCGEREEAFAQGDIMLFFKGSGHILADAPDSIPVFLFDAVERQPGRMVHQLAVGGDGAATTLICGTFEVAGAPMNHPLLLALPDMLIVHAADAQWLSATIQQLHEELRQNLTGSEMIAGRLCEIMLVRAIRTYFETEHYELTHMSQALSDPHIGQALALIHTQLEMGWRAELLADRVGLSRSAFFARFQELIGEPPARYIRGVMMENAAQWLCDVEQSCSVAECARRLGYTTQSAFSRAFSRYHGASPSAFRQSRLQEHEA